MKKNNEVVTFNEVGFRVYEIDGEFLFDVRDIRDWFGYDSNKDITRSISKGHHVPLSSSQAKTVGLTDVPNRGMTLITQQGLLEVATTLEPRDKKRKKVIGEFRNWVYKIVIDFMTNGYVIANDISAEKISEAKTVLNIKELQTQLLEEDITMKKFREQVGTYFKDIKDLKVREKEVKALAKRFDDSDMTVELSSSVYKYLLELQKELTISIKRSRGQLTRKR